MRQTSTDIDRRIGTRIRELRSARSLSLEGLATLADVSRAMLSRIERGESIPTAQLLNKVCGGLGVTLSALFADTQRGIGPLSRRADQALWRDPETDYLRRDISPAGTGSLVDIVEIAFPPGGSVAFENRHPPGAHQHIWVLEGSLDLELGEAAYRLDEGDCLMMRFDHPVRFRNATKRTVRYAVVISRGPRWA